MCREVKSEEGSWGCFDVCEWMEADERLHRGQRLEKHERLEAGPVGLMGTDTLGLPQELLALGAAQELPGARALVPSRVCSLQSPGTAQHSPGPSVPVGATRSRALGAAVGLCWA